MKTLILKLDITGRPVDWISRQAGALLYCRDHVAWEAGHEYVTLRGGRSRLSGRQSVLQVNSIIATRAVDRSGAHGADVPLLTNARLFHRDGFMCLYCGEVLPAKLLTRDHITPVSRGGANLWENVVTACRSCNQRKDNRTPQESGMRLLAVPYVPNREEGLILENRLILTDQMAFLRARVGRTSRLVQ